ncbi:MAG: 23S rRNA (uracil(1939)-C(5))-methyltransferase RlmD [bacterium]
MLKDDKITVKKGAKINIEIEKIIFPNTGIAYVNDNEIRIKNVLPGQKVRVLLKKKKKNYYQGRLLEVIDKSPLEEESVCNHYDNCGGCNRQAINYEKQMNIKSNQVKDLFEKNDLKYNIFKDIVPGPKIFEYRNKMEFSFGDLNKGGTIQLGMHPQGHRFDVVSVTSCKLVDNDFRLILSTVLDYFRQKDFKKYHVISREGYLRNLVIRKGLKTGEILVNLVTTSQTSNDYSDLTKNLLNLNLDGELVGFLQTINDDYADTIKCDELITHHGRNYFYEKLLELTFKITPFAFFQPNTFGAEKLYSTVINFISDAKSKIIFDLYCGTGTISQILARDADKVYGIELIEEAVEMARENATINNDLGNCEFIAGDVLEKIDLLNDQADIIVIDPPRPGIHPKTLQKIINVNTDEIIYVSCNPRTLVRDLLALTENSYNINKIQCIDMFPHTHHVETVVHLLKTKNDH